MRVISLIEVISAAHIAKYVEGPFTQRGGIMLVGPPGHWKSSIIQASLLEYPDSLILSDINLQELARLKDALVGGRYTSIGFGEFEKLYERNPQTAANVEGTLRAMVEEGFDKMSFQSQQMQSMKAQIFVVGGMTPSAYAKRFQAWIDSGFARRFLWVNYRLENPDIIVEAIRNWKKHEFGRPSFRVPANRQIPYKISRDVDSAIEKMLDHQPSKETPFVVMKKIYCALSWRYNARKARQIMEDFAPGLSRTGANLTK